MNKKTKKTTDTIEALRKVSIFPFVEKPCEFDKIKTSKAYILWEKSVTDPESLTREEKDWLFEQFCYQSCYTETIRIGGWRITYPTAKMFLVQSADSRREWRLYSAFDKTSIRNHFKFAGGCGEIIEYTKKETK